ncbi:hypothetical protein [Aquiflexum sp.]|uniref:hypothetical protein n=1 Tax=Aquiflexum sp. TaxID=1872584 RepID=UPI0035937019
MTFNLKHIAIYNLIYPENLQDDREATWLRTFLKNKNLYRKNLTAIAGGFGFSC